MKNNVEKVINALDNKIKLSSWKFPLTCREAVKCYLLSSKQI